MRTQLSERRRWQWRRRRRRLWCFFFAILWTRRCTNLRESSHDRRDELRVMLCCGSDWISLRYAQRMDRSDWRSQVVACAHAALSCVVSSCFIFISFSIVSHSFWSSSSDAEWKITRSTCQQLLNNVEEKQQQRRKQRQQQLYQQ